MPFPLLRRAAIVIAMLGAIGQPCDATDFNARSPALADVTAAMALARDGDNVVVPAGSATWSSTLTVNKAITLRGAGIGGTIIKDGVQLGKLLQVTLLPGKMTRISGIEFQNGGRAKVAPAPNGILHVDGSNTDGSKFRMDHCKWDHLKGYPVFNTIIGVIDHCVYSTDTICNYVYGSRWNGNAFGDGSWAGPSALGSDQFLFFEDNTFTITSALNHGIADCFQGGRYVIRHNTGYNATIQSHGTESQARGRGARAAEVYNNNFTGNNQNSIAGDVRSGVFLIHDNTWSGFQGTAHISIRCHRIFFPFAPWAGADGTNPWDNNQPGGPFYSGTASGASSGQTVKVSGNPGWKPNQWVGYAVKRKTNLAGSSSIDFGEIKANGSDTLTYSGNGGYFKPSMTFASGDSLQIWKVNQALDQPGVSGGALVTGSLPSRPAGWYNQVIDPCYTWNNKQEGGAPVNFSTDTAVIKPNVHYYNNTAKPGYTPYTYPHPLVSGNPAPPTPTPIPTSTPAVTPNPPTNLKAGPGT